MLILPDGYNYSTQVTDRPRAAQTENRGIHLPRRCSRYDPPHRNTAVTLPVLPLINLLGPVEYRIFQAWATAPTPTQASPLQGSKPYTVGVVIWHRQGS